MERVLAFKAIVGSHNYNLNTAESDLDYKVYVYPTFDDLYDKETFAEQTITVDEDNDAHDIRKLPSLLFKANINYVEVLFSEQTHIPSGEYQFVNGILSMREQIARMNLPKMFNACVGMHHQKVSMLLKGTEGTKHLVDMFKYDTKQAQHAFRVLCITERYARNDFFDFKEAIYYDLDKANPERRKRDLAERMELMNIKHGYHSYDEIRKKLSDKLAEVKEKYEPLFMSQPVDFDLNATLEKMVKDAVRRSITKELS